MPKGGTIEIKQEVVEEALDVLAKVEDYFEADDKAHAVRWNAPYLPSKLTARIKEAIAHLTGALVETVSIEDKQEKVE